MFIHGFFEWTKLNKSMINVFINIYLINYTYFVNFNVQKYTYINAYIQIHTLDKYSRILIFFQQVYFVVMVKVFVLGILLL